jgi:serine protease inhibitor
MRLPTNSCASACAALMAMLIANSAQTEAQALPVRQTVASAATGKMDRAQLDLADKAISHASNQLAFDLLKRLEIAHPKQNIFISPTSIETVLAMLSLGATGQTKTEINSVAHLTMPSSQLGQSFKSFLDQFRHLDSETTLQNANAVFVDKGWRMLPAYVATTKDDLYASVQSCQFNDSKSADEINSWIASKTSGKIKNVIQGNLSSEQGVVLVNATYFKSTWQNQFNPSVTRDDEFHTDLKTVTVPMMHVTEHFNCGKDEGAEFIELPYADGRLSALIVMPTQDDLQEYTKRLNATTYSALFKGMHKREAHVGMPRFKSSYKNDMVLTLQGAGMKKAFTSQAEFGNMCPNKSFSVGYFLHATYLDVNEKGTEAAAATVAEGAKGLSFPTWSMDVDHPFLFFIINNSDRSILFSAAIYDPTVE